MIWPVFFVSEHISDVQFSWLLTQRHGHRKRGLRRKTQKNGLPSAHGVCAPPSLTPSLLPPWQPADAVIERSINPSLTIPKGAAFFLFLPPGCLLSWPAAFSCRSSKREIERSPVQSSQSSLLLSVDPFSVVVRARHFAVQSRSMWLWCLNHTVGFFFCKLLFFYCLLSKGIGASGMRTSAVTASRSDWWRKLPSARRFFFLFRVFPPKCPPRFELFPAAAALRRSGTRRHDLIAPWSQMLLRSSALGSPLAPSRCAPLGWFSEKINSSPVWRERRKKPQNPPRLRTHRSAHLVFGVT